MRAEIGLVSIMAAAGNGQKRRRIAGAKKDRSEPPVLIALSAQEPEPVPMMDARRYSASICRISRRRRSRPFHSSMLSWNAARSRGGGGDPV